MRKWLTVGALIAGLTAATPSIAAAPAETSLQILRQATLVTPTDIEVIVEVQCPAGTTEGVAVKVSQPQAVGPNTDGSGLDFAECTGAKQTVVIPVSGGPFTPGSAFARASASNLQLDFGNLIPYDSRVIDVS